jgi:hypothetical protein
MEEVKKTPSSRKEVEEKERKKERARLRALKRSRAKGSWDTTGVTRTIDKLGK